MCLYRLQLASSGNNNLYLFLLQRSGREATTDGERGTYVLTPKENKLFEQYYQVIGHIYWPAVMCMQFFQDIFSKCMVLSSYSGSALALISIISLIINYLGQVIT